MKKSFALLLLVFYMSMMPSLFAAAQCSICTKTAAQMGEKPAKGLNLGILYLGLAPFAIVGIIGYRWWKRNGSVFE